MTRLPPRFWGKVDMTETCWLWTGGVTSRGYGKTTLDGKAIYAHRAAYAALVGPIPTGAQVDHKCHDRRCVRPDHLQAVDGSLNMQNRKGAARNSRSGIRGVFRHGDRWRVQAKANGRIHSGGLFDSLEDAEAAAIALRSRLMQNNLADRVEA